jgi:DNA repair protein RadB
MNTNEENYKIERISAGSYDLNKWLFGGYEKDIITMVAGPAGSGKTNFVLLASCSQAKKGNKVIFVDSEGGFSVERVKQIAGVEKYKEILDNILLLQPTSFDEQKNDFERLLKSVSEGQVGLIVVDGMAMLYRLELGDAVKSKEDERIREVNREVARQMRSLAEISRKKNIPVMITNQVYNGFLSEEDIKNGVERQTNIVGGDLMKYWCKTVIELKMDRGKRKAILLKHRSIKEKEMFFEIKDKGIFRKGIF